MCLALTPRSLGPPAIAAVAAPLLRGSYVFNSQSYMSLSGTAGLPQSPEPLLAMSCIGQSKQEQALHASMHVPLDEWE